MHLRPLPDDPDLFTPQGFYEASPGSDPGVSGLHTLCGGYGFTARVRDGRRAMPGASGVTSPASRRRPGTVGARERAFFREGF